MDIATTTATLNAIHTTEEIFFEINGLLHVNFPLVKFAFTPKIIRNITDPNEQEYLIITEHDRAHRNFRENFNQLKQKYFFPKMKARVRATAIQCEICKKQKFDTNPKNRP